MSRWVTSCHSDVPSASPSASRSSASPVIVRMAAHHILLSVLGPLLIADAPALLYRAFFALPDSITDGADRPVNARLGSVNQVLWCVEKYGPRAVVLCFGQEPATSGPTACPAYHARPPPIPD